MVSTNFYVDKINEETLKRINVQKDTDQRIYKSVDISLANGNQEVLHFITKVLNILIPTGLLILGFL